MTKVVNQPTGCAQRPPANGTEFHLTESPARLNRAQGALFQKRSRYWAERVRFHGNAIVELVLNGHGDRSAVARRYAFKILPLVTPVVATAGPGPTYYVSTRDKGIGRAVFSRGSYEQDLMATALELMEEAVGRSPLLTGRTFIDVGANIGTSTIPALSLFGAADAVVFEPAPMNFDLLRCNLIANDLCDRVQAFRMALSDRSGTATLEVAPGDWGDHRLRMAPNLDDGAFYRESNRPTITVETARFDDVVTQKGIDLDRLGLFWVDAQGHEGHILSGAGSLTAAGTPMIVEYWPYGLRRAEGLTLLHDLVADRCRRVIDVRASAWERKIVDVHPTELSRLEGRYNGPVGYTDLILLT